ncbi:MAG: TonB-dependent receptor [Desulfobulbaceae bacterium]|nr:TonB-dependent receptor [Desulfobulbaceae bacterium]
MICAEIAFAHSHYLEMDLEQLMAIPVYAASKHQQTIREAPSSITVIRAEEIQRFGYRNFGELLRAVPGFYVSQNRGSTGFVGTRGINRTTDYRARFLVQVDGHRLTDPVYGTLPNQQDFPLDLDLIERVEIVRGPGSSLHGSNAFVGIVNVVTRKGRDMDGVEAALSTGSLSTNTARLSYGTETEAGVDVLLSGTLYGSSGNNDLYFPEFDSAAGGTDGHARNIDADHAGSVFGRVGYKGLTLAAGHADREKQIPSGRYDAIFGDPGVTNWEKRTYVTAEYSQTLASDWEILARGSFDRYFYAGTIPMLSQQGEPFDYKTDIDARWLRAELQASRSFGRHRLTAGGEYHSLYDLDAHLFYETQGYFLGDRYRTDVEIASYGLYLQDEFRLNDKLLFNVGIRLDEYDTFGETINPRLGMIYLPWEKTTFKLLYGRAFRAPVLSELFYQVENDSRNINPFLDPEKITIYEAIWEQRITSWLQTSLSVYHNDISNVIEFSPTADTINTYAYVNMGETTVNGVEATVELGTAKGVRGRLSYAYADVDSDGYVTDNSPRHLLKGGMLIPLGSERYTAALEAHYISSRYDKRGMETGDYWIANINLFARPLGDNLDLSLGVYNLFDEKYVDPASSLPFQTEQDGRTARLKLTYRF